MNFKKIISGLATVILGKNFYLLLYTNHGEASKELINIFNNKIGRKIINNDVYNTCHNKYVEEKENVDHKKLYINNMNDFSQNKLCHIVDETRQIIGHKSKNSFTNEEKNTFKIKTTSTKTTTFQKKTTFVKKITSTKKGTSEKIITTKKITFTKKKTTIKKSTKINTKNYC